MILGSEPRMILGSESVRNQDGLGVLEVQQFVEYVRTAIRSDPHRECVNHVQNYGQTAAQLRPGPQLGRSSVYEIGSGHDDGNMIAMWYCDRMRCSAWRSNATHFQKHRIR